MKVPVLGILLGLVGIWFLASAATTEGLLPNGHGLGRASEVIIGAVLLIYAIFRGWQAAKVK
ncbi:MAG: hypothetical protein WBD22_00860 [Pyrinomonadaceae bacterium]